MDSYVRDVDSLAALAATLGSEGLVAVDTEAASFHKYHDRIYLIQLSGRTDTAIIDPLACTDLAPLGVLLADRDVEKIFHDADYDLRVLDRDYGFRPVHIFDTRIAAQLTAEPALGLAALLEKYVGVKLSKEHQKGDWSRRPLPPAMLAYAADDTRYLLALRVALRARLIELGRLSWAEEEFARLEDLRWTGGDSAEAYLRVKGAKALLPRQFAAFRALHEWRDQLARAQDKATFRIIANEALLAVSRALPTSREALAEIADLPPALAARHGPALLECVARALALEETALPQIERTRPPPRDPTFDARVERLKVARNGVATALALDPGVLCPRGLLEAVARAVPRDRAALALVPDLRAWQADVLGDVLLAAVG